MKMKDKKATQAAERQKHKDNLRAKRKSAPMLERAEATLEEKPKILIVCEGENTEPSYFNQFRLSSATVKSVGEGYNTKSLVQRAIQLAERSNYDQVWCVFDKDDFPDKDFNDAIKLATKNKFSIAYSNQSFEYWLLLHFNDHQGGAMHRSICCDKLNEHLSEYGTFYDANGSKKISSNIFDLLVGADEATKVSRTELAIRRAERNYNEFDHQNPAKEESSTRVFLLVQELLKYL